MKYNINNFLFLDPGDEVSNLEDVHVFFMDNLEEGSAKAIEEFLILN